MITTPDDYNTLVEAIASGEMICIREASNRSQIHYMTLRRRLEREAIPMIRLHGRRYLPTSALEKPALKVP